MKRLIALMLVPLVPFGLAAQTQSPANADRTPDEKVATLSSPLLVESVQPQVQLGRRKRRGSMVGYISDSEIASKLQFRIDGGFGLDTPDRTEFFYAKCGCYRDLQGNAAYDPEAPGPGPGIVTDMNFKQVYVHGEYALSERFSAFVMLPFRRIEPQSFAAGSGSFEDQAGVGDLQAGIKIGLLRSPTTSVTLQVQGYFPTGDASRGLGTDHASVEPSLLFNYRASDRLSWEGQIGDWHPIGGSEGVPITSADKFTGDVLSYGIGPSYELYRSANDVTFTPVLELVGWRVLNGMQTGENGDASGTNIVNFKIGARVGWGDASSVYLGFGKALTEASWYDNIVRLEYRLLY